MLEEYTIFHGLQLLGFFILCNELMKSFLHTTLATSRQGAEYLTVNTTEQIYVFSAAHIACIDI